jgi:competence protein ComEC
MRYEEVIFWRRAPFVKILIPFILGILLQWYYPLPSSLIIIAISFALPGAIFLFFLPLRFRFRYTKIHAVVIYVLIFFFGSYITYEALPGNHKSWYGSLYQKNDVLLMVLQESLVEKENSYRTTAELKGILRKQKFIPCQGSLLVYINKNNHSQRPRFGDLIKTEKYIQPITPIGNPGAFDNRQYQAFQKTYFQIYLNNNDYQIVKHNEANEGRRWIYNLQQEVLVGLRKFIKNEQHLGIAEALLIGYKNDLDVGLTQTYTNAGVVHVIAISGLHLGLIYMSMWWIFGHLPILKNRIFFRVVFIFFSIWLFSFIAGCNSSVLRSAVMFSCILLGKLINRQSSVFNTLAASAFLLICFHPYYLWDFGFQLSYLAILGIVCLQKPIQNSLNFRFQFGKQFAAMVATTFAAQIATLPVCLYYFHQFPNYFLITNLIAVPLSTAILFLEIALLACSPFYKMAMPMGNLISWLIGFLNKSMESISHWPFSLTKNIHISLMSTIVLYLIIISIVTWFIRKKKSHLKWGLLFLIMFVIIKNIESVYLYRQRKVVVYKASQQSAIDIINGNSYVYLGDSNLIEKNMSSVLQSRCFLKVNPVAHFHKRVLSKNYIIDFGSQKIAFISSAFKGYLANKSLSADYLLISGNPQVQLNELIDKFHPVFLIIDGNNKFSVVEKWKNEAAAYHIPIHVISSDGAFVLNIH